MRLRLSAIGLGFALLAAACGQTPASPAASGSAAPAPTAAGSQGVASEAPGGETAAKREARESVFQERYQALSKKYLKELRSQALIEIRQ